MRTNKYWYWLKNLSIDLLCKLIYWFLYEENIAGQKILWPNRQRNLKQCFFQIQRYIFFRIHWDCFGQYSIRFWDKVFKNGPNKICGRQPLKNLKWYGLPRQTVSLQFFLKAVFHEYHYLSKTEENKLRSDTN